MRRTAIVAIALLSTLWLGGCEKPDPTECDTDTDCVVSRLHPGCCCTYHAVNVDAFEPCEVICAQVCERIPARAVCVNNVCELEYGNADR